MPEVFFLKHRSSIFRSKWVGWSQSFMMINAFNKLLSCFRTKMSDMRHNLLKAQGPDSIGAKSSRKSARKSSWKSSWTSCQKVTIKKSRNLENSVVCTDLLFKLDFRDDFHGDFFPIELSPCFLTAVWSRALISSRVTRSHFSKFRFESGGLPRFVSGWDGQKCPTWVAWTRYPGPIDWHFWRSQPETNRGSDSPTNQFRLS